MRKYRYKGYEIVKCQVGFGWNIVDPSGKIVSAHASSVRESHEYIRYELEQAETLRWLNHDDRVEGNPAQRTAS